MTFLTEDCDLKGTLADMREKIERGDYKQAYTPDPLVTHDWTPDPVPRVYDLTDCDPWADRYDNPKD